MFSVVEAISKIDASAGPIQGVNQENAIPTTKGAKNANRFCLRRTTFSQLKRREYF